MKNKLFLLIVWIILITAIVVSGCDLHNHLIRKPDFTYSFDGNSAIITGYNGRDKHVNIPPEINQLPITQIGSYAFSDTRIKSITIPNSVTAIGIGAFSYCKSLKNITLPDNIKMIKAEMFKGCKKLTSIKIPNSVTVIQNSAFADTGLTTIVLPDGLIYIGHNAFRWSNLSSITIPNSIIYIGDSVFSTNKHLTNINIPEGVTEIPFFTFAECKNLKSIILPDSLLRIESQAFNKTGLSKITIPAGVTSIGSHAFLDCSKLSRVVMLSETPPKVNETSFSRTSSELQIEVPKVSVNVYKNSPGWSEYASRIVGY